MEERPNNAPEECVGPTSANAGKASSCEGCPNQKACSSGQQNSSTALHEQNIEHENIRKALDNVAHVVLVMSGKGGVGKSTVCCQLAHTLAARGYGVGVLDIDICGPSVAQMLGVSGREVHRSASGWTPVYSNGNLACMSVSFLLPEDNPDAAVVWRGPRKNGMIKQFLTETCWDEEGLDYLIIDTPPGTSDEHISTIQFLQGALGMRNNNPSDDDTEPNIGGAVVVTTPEEVSMADVRKELNFCIKTKLPVIGLVENMSSFQTPVKDLTFLRKTDNNTTDCTNEILNTIREKCPEILDTIASTEVFPSSGAGVMGMSNKFNVPYLGKLPLDKNLLRSCEEGKCFVQAYPDSVSVDPLNQIVDKIVNHLPL